MAGERKLADRHRRSIRLQGYDYTQDGAYFITICAHERACSFGDIVDGVMRLNALSKIVHEEWLKSAILRPRVMLGEFVVMPNHIHGVIMLTNGGDTMSGRGTLQRAPTTTVTTVERFGKPVSNSIPTIIRLFKSATTKRINEQRNTPCAPVWQRNYYEHIVRNDGDLRRIREYIVNNPAQWNSDRQNPNRVGSPMSNTTDKEIGYGG